MRSPERSYNDPPQWARQRTLGNQRVAVAGGERPLRDTAAEDAAGRAAADSRVVVVSGGNRGLGLAVVRALAGRGMRVVMGSRSPERGRAALDGLGDLADRVAVRQLDLTDEVSVTRLAATVDRQLSRCDVLINNAAVLIDDEDSSLDVGIDVVQRTLETNLIGTWRLTQAIAPLMRRNGYGRIVNITSELGSIGAMSSGLPAYRIAQTAINALTRVLADDLADDHILVNACCPGRSELAVADEGETIEFAASADTAVWLATLPDDGPTGGFFRDQQPIDW